MSKKSNLLALAVASAFAAAPAVARDEVIALTGTQASALPAGVNISSLGNPVINQSGRVAFFAGLSGAGVDTSNNQTIYRDAIVIARTGNAAPGLTDITLSGLSAPLINNFTDVAFKATLAGAGVTSANDQALYRNTILTARTGGQAHGLPTGVLFASFDPPTQLNNAFTGATGSELAYRVSLTGTGVSALNNLALYKGPTPVARTGDAAPGLPGLSFINVFNLDINNTQAAYSVALTGPGVTASNQFAHYRDTTLLARSGDAAPGLPAGTVFGLLGFPFINNAGQVAFTPNLHGPGVDASNGRAIYRDSTMVVRVGDAPGLPPGMVIAAFVLRGINSFGQVVYGATLGGPAVNITNDSAIYRDTTLIARAGTALPGLPAGATFGDIFSLGAINNAGHVMITTFLNGPPSINNTSGMWLGDGTEVVKIVHQRDVLNGKTVSGFAFLGNDQLNDAGQVAYRVSFTDGTQGNFKFTPDLHWRQNSSGGWDSAPGWTLGIAPGSIYDLKIDPSASVTITGPATDRQVRTLELGGGTGIATLSLLGGKITTLADSLYVRANGVLTGDGAIGSFVVNQGTVRAQNLTLEAGVWNQAPGLVTGSGRINAEVFNDGRISVGSGQSLRIGGSVLNFIGSRADVIGGELETTSSFVNSGQLAARNAMLRFGGGLSNFAQVAMSFGTNDVFGNVFNQPGGKILVSGGSNATFWNDVANSDEIRASAGSTIVYFGVLSGAGSLTGAGTHFVEGTLSPGASPGILNAVNLTLGPASTLLIDINGLTVGTEYDRLVVSNSLVLDGTLSVDLGTFAPAAGNEFDILDWGTLSGTFHTLDLPSLGALLAWNTSDLYFDGTISVAAIPEPQTYALLLAGLGLLGFAARRKGVRPLFR